MNEALSDKPSGQLDHNMRVETDQILSQSQRITACMARCGCRATSAACSVLLAAHGEQSTAQIDAEVLTQKFHDGPGAQVSMPTGEFDTWSEVPRASEWL